MRGSSPRMTKVLFGTAPALQRTRKTSHAYFFFTSLMLENVIPSARSLV